MAQEGSHLLINTLIQQVFTESLICTGHCCSYSGYREIDKVPFELLVNRAMPRMREKTYVNSDRGKCYEEK